MTDAHAVSRIRVRYGETDQMGVAYHANYLVWCEVGRTDLLRDLGPMSYARMEEEGIRLAVAEASLRYTAPARYDDVVAVETRLERTRSRFLDFSYRIVLEAPAERGVPGTLLATASTVLAAIDEAGRTRVIPRQLRDAFERFSDGRTRTAPAV